MDTTADVQLEFLSRLHGLEFGPDRGIGGFRFGQRGGFIQLIHRRDGRIVFCNSVAPRAVIPKRDAASMNATCPGVGIRADLG